jgi:DNA-binding SARP family transcriptional activator
MSQLAIALLGTFQVSLAGSPVVGFESDKERALLAYLALEGERPHRREALAFLLWPEFPERAARTNLRHALAKLRRAIGDHLARPPYLTITPQTLQFNLESDHRLDVVIFQQLLKGGESGEPAFEQLEEAVALYQGLFLEGFSIPDSAPFEEWVSLKREGLTQQVLTALHQLVIHFQGQRAYERALPYAWRGVELAPWREEGYRHLMTLLALSGRRSEALRQYERCRAALAEELGVEPASKTEQLYDRIRSGTLGEVSREGQPHHNLPAQTTPLIGREQELAQLADLLADPGQRLITIVGAGGMGKTRLALEAALAQLDYFPQGVFFVSVAGLDAPAGIVPAIAEAVGFTFYQGTPPHQQLLAYLSGKTMLLLLDNFEHLLAGASLLVDILQAAPQVRLLITSRARLNLAAEQVYPLVGLAYPTAD